MTAYYTFTIDIESVAEDAVERMSDYCDVSAPLREALEEIHRAPTEALLALMQKKYREMYPDCESIDPTVSWERPLPPPPHRSNAT